MVLIMKSLSPQLLAGMTILSLSPKWSQVKSQATGSCIKASVDSTGDVFISVAEDCVCDPSCNVCGYYGESTSGPEDCFSCAEGFVFKAVYDDGSGSCTAAGDSSTSEPPTATYTPSKASTSPPDDGADSSDPSPSPTGGICVIVYQLADNNLESDIRGDLSEMTKSAFTQSASTTTWVYHDSLNQESEYYTGGPLEDVYNADGTPLTENFEGSRYLRWDHDLGKLVVDITFPFELNSDLPTVLQAFIEHALTDCVAKGTSEFFLALSSHGAGFAGFGGDDNTSRRARKLTQSNADVHTAIQGALSSVSGAPLILDVLGFDACLMQSMDALDDFANLTKYYLASEATEPGHGWAYNELSATTTALDLAINIWDTFLTSVQDYGFHATPKTLAVANATAYYEFRDAWDALCSAMADILASGNDADFHASLVRARGNTFSFEGDLDDPSVQLNSAMDIGDFFAKFFEICVPNESSELYMLMTNARDAYSAMFVASGVGPGTSSMATGMHITWVSKQEFVNYDYYQDFVFPTTGSSPLMGAPNYSRFLELFYVTSTPTANVGASVCLTSSKSSRDPTTASELLIDPDVEFIDDVLITEIRSEITRNVDFVFIEYGMDVTHLLQEDSLLRRLDETARRQKVRRLEDGDAGKSPPSSFAHRREDMKWRYRDSGDRSRRLQNDTEFGTGDYFLIFGGDVAVQYNGSNIAAVWDSTFYWIQSDDDLEPLYTFDDGGGLKSIPVCYFNQNNTITSEQLALGITVDEAIDDLGCMFGYLSFSAAEDSDGEFTLYAYRGRTLSEVPRAAGRNIVPISFIEYSVGNEYFDELLGGFSSIIVPWTKDANLSIFSLSDYDNLAEFGSDTAFIDIIAYDEDANITDDFTFFYAYVNDTGSENRRQLLVSDETGANSSPFHRVEGYNPTYDRGW